MQCLQSRIRDFALASCYKGEIWDLCTKLGLFWDQNLGLLSFTRQIFNIFVRCLKCSMLFILQTSNEWPEQTQVSLNSTRAKKPSVSYLLESVKHVYMARIYFRFKSKYIFFHSKYPSRNTLKWNLGLASKIRTFLGPFQEPGPNWDQVPNLGPRCKYCLSYSTYLSKLIQLFV